MIYIQVINKYWSPGRDIIKDEVIRSQFEDYIANEFIEYIKQSIDIQRYKRGWSPLNKSYVQYKRDNNLSIKTWEATSQLKNSLKVFNRPNMIEIGYSKSVRHKMSGDKLYEIAKKLEYGSIKVPPRPLFRLSFLYMSKNIRLYYNRFCKERGYEI